MLLQYDETSILNVTETRIRLITDALQLAQISRMDSLGELNCIYISLVLKRVRLGKETSLSIYI